jgi:hypothetical protein
MKLDHAVCYVCIVVCGQCHDDVVIVTAEQVGQQRKFVRCYRSVYVGQGSTVGHVGQVATVGQVL